jgi:hypothetical protein
MNRRTALLLLVVADVALFFVSGIPSVKHADGGVGGVFSELVWLGFLLGLLSLLVWGVVYGVHRVRRVRASE